MKWRFRSIAAVSRSLACTPVPRSAPTVRDGDDLSRGAGQAINHRKRKAPKYVAASSLQETRPALRGFRDVHDSPVQFRQECCGCGRISFEVPVISAPCVTESLWMKLYGKARHQRLSIARRASDHGVGRTFPSSKSFKRLAISASHAASAPGSTVSSKLSSREPARAARASEGSFSASSNNFAVFVTINNSLTPAAAIFTWKKAGATRNAVPARRPA